MADRNRNFLSRDSINEHSSSNHHSSKPLAGTTKQIANNNELPKKEGLYAKKENSNYQRYVDYPKNDLDTPSKKAPIVGWQNGSPTLFPSSPEDQHVPAAVVRPILPETPSESSGIGRDDEDTENLSSIADERNIPSTPGLTIDKSLESFSQDVDLSLATASNPDLEQLDFESPADSEYRPPATPGDDSYLTSPNLTVGVSPTDKPDQDPGKSDEKRADQNHVVPAVGSPEKGAGILVKRQYSEQDSGATLVQDSLRGNEKELLNEKDSIDDSDVMLEIYDDEDDNSSTDNDSRKKPKIPDGGWGWVVVCSSLVISMIADGVSFSFGLLYVQFLYEFEASKATTAWIGSLFMAVPLLSGPIMSALVDRYGCRKMTIAGGLISGTGFVLSSYAHSIGVMYLTFGVLAGLGLGLCYVTAVVSIAFWFDKKRTLAVGLGACGTGIGTFVYAPMTTYFIEEFGWRGCVLLLAGTFFNMIVCGTVMRDPEWWILEQKKQQGPTSPKKNGQGGNGAKLQDGTNRSQGSPADEDFPGVEELRRLMKSGQAPEYLLQNLRTSTETRINTGGNPAFRSVVNLPTFVRQSEKVIFLFFLEQAAPV